MNNLLKKLSPIQKVLLSFLLLIFSGTLLLKIPWATKNGISFINALFTSTSAVCVTGLIVLDTAKDFTIFGQTVILLLIQFGALGIMTFSIAILVFLGGKFSIKWRYTFESIYNDIHNLPIRSILKRIVIYTFYIEFISAIILFTQFIQQFELPEAMWHSLFHSISAFCNAGFSTFTNNLVDYRTNKIIMYTISLEVILGGIGFLVLTEMLRVKYKFKGFFTQFTLHTKVVLITTAVLLLFGTVSFLMLEWNYILKDMPFLDKITTSFFQSMTCRTAGFNTVEIGSLRESTLFMMIALMFIGGSPGSIAGGIKTTTIASVFGLIYSKFSGKKHVIFWSRTLSHDIVEKSTTLIILSGLFIYISTFILLFLHSFDIDHTFISGLFEVTSAFNTVGLTTGVTSTIYIEGKILLSIVMYVGRLGPFALITALTANKKDIPFEYASEDVMIG